MKKFLTCLLLACLTPGDGNHRNCTDNDYVYEYTTCQADGSRWRVSVPKVDGACTGGVDPLPPQRGKPCDFSCAAGEYLQTQGDEECHKCLPGTYSLGGDVRYDSWDKLPQGFTVETKKSKAEYYGSQASSEVNCTESNWDPRGDNIAVQSLGGHCESNLILRVDLINIGRVTFTYNYPGYYLTVRVRIKNEHCQTAFDFDSDTLDGSALHYLESTGRDEWREHSFPLSTGPNTIIWEAVFYDDYISHYSSSGNAPFKLKTVNVEGIAYALTCTPCSAGSVSDAGATSCGSCPADYYAPEKGMSECLPCNTTTHYSYSGATECIERPACQETDYFVTHTPCDDNGKTQMMYKWVDPKRCQSDLPTSVKLPPSGKPEDCPPCNPGMSSVNTTDNRCIVCPKGHYSDGRQPCKECPPATEPASNIELKFWSNQDSLPVSVYTTCIKYWSYHCVDHGWEFLSSFIGTNPYNDPRTIVKLVINTAGFRVSQRGVDGVPGAAGEVRFIFETVCENDCHFGFHTGYEYEGTGEVESWDGTQTKREYRYIVQSTHITRFVWTFQKVGNKDDDMSYGSWYGPSDGEDSKSRLKIYAINITNTVDGGASQCVGCLIGANSTIKQSSQCQGCPEGHYVDKKQCFPCPANTRLNNNHPIGVENCIACGLGTISKPGSVNCYSDCTFKDENGHVYNFTRLGIAAQNFTGQSIFSAVGHRYSHFFSLDICQDGMRAHCGHKHKAVSVSDDKREIKGIQRDVWSHVCRATLLDHSIGDMFYIEPVSLGDRLQAVISADENNGTFPIPPFFNDLRKHNETVLYFIFEGTSATPSCPKGRSTFVALHCDVTAGGEGKLALPLSCPDGTCDGCNYGFVWHTALACPLCTKDDYTWIDEKCKENKSRTIYTWNTPMQCFGGVALPHDKVTNCSKVQVIVKVVEVPQKSNILDYKGYIGIAVGVAALFVTVLVILYLKNRKLEYKYQQLKQSGKEGDELPAPETCVQESGDEDEVVYQQGIKPGKKLLKKLKGMAGKGKNDDMEDMDFQTVQLEPSSSNV